MSREAAWRTFRRRSSPRQSRSACRVHRCAWRAVGARIVLVRRVRARRARAGVREGRLRPAGARRRLRPRRTGGDGVAQPATLRRIRGPRRDRGAACRRRGVSTFQTSSDVFLEPGESASVGDYEVRYVEPTQNVSAAEQRLTLGRAPGDPGRRALRDAARRATTTRAATRTRLLPRGLRGRGDRARSAARTASTATSGPRCSPISRGSIP